MVGFTIARWTPDLALRPLRVFYFDRASARRMSRRSWHGLARLHEIPYPVPKGPAAVESGVRSGGGPPGNRPPGLLPLAPGVSPVRETALKRSRLSRSSASTRGAASPVLPRQDWPGARAVLERPPPRSRRHASATTKSISANWLAERTPEVDDGFEAVGGFSGTEALRLGHRGGTGNDDVALQAHRGGGDSQYEPQWHFQAAKKWTA
jgi:hypothetical protein